MTHVINSDCIMCGACETECKNGAITAGDDIYLIDSALCEDCGDCVDVCPTAAIVEA